MGYTSIVWIYRDGIDRADDSPEEWTNIASQLGDAVLQVCLGVPGQLVAVTSEMVKLKKTNRGRSRSCGSGKG